MSKGEGWGVGKGMLSSASNPAKDLQSVLPLSPNQMEALKFGLGSQLLGVTSGMMFGGLSALSRGLDQTPGLARVYILKSVKAFSKQCLSALAAL
jgi:hypothetical protein